MNPAGTVVSLHIAPAGMAPMTSVEEVYAVSGKGLEGDRYFSRIGTFSDQPGTGRDVTLIEVEAMAALRRDYQIKLAPGESRRNIVTRGVPLNHLVGIEFAVGAVMLRGARLCEPCSHLEKLTRKGTMRGLIHRGGLRADIVTHGLIRVGDTIQFKTPADG
jgi:MOSC domain-containing protein YiiM